MTDPLEKSLAGSPGINSSIPVESITKRRGCFFWGCGTSIFFALVGIVAVGFLAYWFLTGQVRQYTAEAAAELPEVEYSDADMAQLEQRLQQIASADKTTRVVTESSHWIPLDSVAPADTAEMPVPEETPPGPGDLVLSARDINALISRNPQLRGRVFVTIEDGQIGGEVSVPMESLPGGAGRFFNASATFSVELRDAQLFVTVVDAYVKDKQAPKVLLDALASENLARDINKHPHMKPRLEKFESLNIVNDKVILRAKANPTTEATKDEVAEPVDESGPK